MSVVYLEVVGCSRHGFWAVTLQSDEANGGHRLTPTKCCGTWDKTIARWPLTKKEVAELSADILANGAQLLRDGAARSSSEGTK